MMNTGGLKCNVLLLLRSSDVYVNRKFITAGVANEECFALFTPIRLDLVV